MAVSAELTQVDSLPSTNIQRTILDGDGNLIASKDSLDMARHIVWTLISMQICIILRHKLLEYIIHVYTDIRVIVLVKADARRRMLDEQVQEANLDVPDLGQSIDNFVLNEVHSLRSRG